MLTSHVRMQGFPGKFYCPRMATMNKPAYAAIQVSSPLPAIPMLTICINICAYLQTQLTSLLPITWHGTWAHALHGPAVASHRPWGLLHSAAGWRRVCRVGACSTGHCTLAELSSLAL